MAVCGQQIRAAFVCGWFNAIPDDLSASGRGRQHPGRSASKAPFVRPTAVPELLLSKRFGRGSFSKEISQLDLTNPNFIDVNKWPKNAAENV